MLRASRGGNGRKVLRSDTPRTKPRAQLLQENSDVNSSLFDNLSGYFSHVLPIPFDYLGTETTKAAHHHFVLTQRTAAQMAPTRERGHIEPQDILHAAALVTDKMVVL